LSDAALWDALATACLADEVRAMPQGLMTWIGDGGTRLSGGQRKRLSLARALLAGRPWLLLDEPGEGLDPATEQRLTNNLVAWLDRTKTGLIIVTHRPAMLALAGRQLTMAG
jgi:ATP-binding cassette subfamily C protein CydC